MRCYEGAEHVTRWEFSEKVLQNRSDIHCWKEECELCERMIKFYIYKHTTFQFWVWPSIALAIFLFDLVFRYLNRFFTTTKLLSMKLPLKNAILLTFRLNDNISIRPGQYFLLQCENLSTLEWHPFTITDFVIEPKRTMVTLVISVQGDWTGDLYEKILNLKLHSEKTKKKRRSSQRRRQAKAPRKLIFVLDGPFPSQMEAIVSEKRVVLVGYGIGVAPFISVFNYIM